MRRSIAAAAAAGALLTLGACGGEESGEPTAHEQAELDNAANMLDTEDASPDSLTVEEAPIGNGEAPADTGDVLVADRDANAQ